MNASNIYGNPEKHCDRCNMILNEMNYRLFDLKYLCLNCFEISNKTALNQVLNFLR